MRALAAVFLVAFFLMFCIFSIGIWSCLQPPKPDCEAQQTENSQKNDCATTYRTFIGGLYSSGEFVRIYHEEIIAVGTVIIAIFTIILGVFTVSLARSTRIAAKAAKLSADAIVRVELPILVSRYARLVSNGQDVTFGGKVPENFEPNIGFTNCGRSAAEMTHGCIEWSVVNKLPSRPKYKNIVPYAHGIVVVKDAYIPLDVPCKIILTPDQIIAVDTSREHLWVFGFISFKDFLGDPHEVRFCYKWRPAPNAREPPLASFGTMKHPQTIHVALRKAAPACRSHLKHGLDRLSSPGYTPLLGPV